MTNADKKIATMYHKMRKTLSEAQTKEAMKDYETLAAVTGTTKAQVRKWVRVQWG